MMLSPLEFSYEQCLKEGLEFKAFLGTRETLKERDEILPFFKARKHLSAFLGTRNALAVSFDRVAHEYPLFGDFACDVVAGDWARAAFVFVEFENAEPESVFVQRRRAVPEWSPRFEHGFSQLVDWFYKLDTQRHLPDFEERFGRRDIHVSGLLVAGRRQELGARERDRLDWRLRHVSIAGRTIHSMTFDDLCDDILARLARLAPILLAGRAAPLPEA